MNSRKFFSRYLPFLLLALILFAVGFWIYKLNKSKTSNTPNSNYFSELSNGSTASESKILNQKSEISSSFTHPTQNFTITLPAGLKATLFEEGESDAVLISSDSSDYQMQITITPFDEDTVLTAERIQKDIPDLKMQNPINVPAGGVPAVSFIDLADNTRQTWFVKDMQLYQVLSNPSSDNTTGKIMETWIWN